MRVWLCMLIMGLSAQAHAGWTYLGTLDGDTVLIDKSTLVQK